MSTTQRLPEPRPLEVIIPPLPNDVALNILSRLPRQYHPVLSAVSKPIRSAVSSPQFFAVRSLLNRNENVLYLRLGSYWHPHDQWFAVHRNPNPISKNLLRFAPVPPIPVDRQLKGSAYAAVGPKVYVIGGYTRWSSNWPEPELSSDVWVLDCRYHTWERGPSLLTPGFNARVAIVGGKIYVVSLLNKLLVEVLDPAVGRWEAIPSPVEDTGNHLFELKLVDGKICIRFRRQEFWLDPLKKTWEEVEVVPSDKPFPPGSCVVDGVPFPYVRENFKWFDEKLGVYKELKGAIEGMPKFLCGHSVINLDDRLVVVFAEARSSSEDAIDSEVKKAGVWGAEIDEAHDEDGNLRGRVHWSEKVPLLPELNWGTPKLEFEKHLFNFFFKRLSVSL